MNGCSCATPSLTHYLILKMGKVIRGQRRGKGSIFTCHQVGRKGAAMYKRADFAERNGYTKGIVTEILHDKGRGAPLARVQYKDAYRFKKINTTVVAPEGMYTGQFIYAGKKGKSSQCYRVCMS